MIDFCAGHPANDDCTIVEVAFTEPSRNSASR
jgi:hypothetical protein